ncbi:hypothetical protein FRX31_011485 [Thalictrum thalictroides]|uniref:Uncharacterized protein n=1 Tax=Thalictrum thalictroides TaxID=46969 RepID=A0A7J6WNF9_THATH|nr:hypothetical protein FRX31_011485 [Thalictrum thalictroides]
MALTSFPESFNPYQYKTTNRARPTIRCLTAMAVPGTIISFGSATLAYHHYHVFNLKLQA